jgi:hypothetical protein
MEKQILLELQRMKQIMGYDRSNPSSVIFEQDLKLDNYVDAVSGTNDIKNQPKSKVGTFDEYGVLEIGPESNKKYPTIMAKPIKIVYDPYVGEPQIKRFKVGTTAKNFISEVKTFGLGEKLSDGTPAPEGVEYIEKNNKKYCLPSKEFWDDVHVKEQYIYQFTNPKTNSIFTMRLKLSSAGQAFIDGVAMSGAEAAMKCKGGRNGWNFEITQNGMAFFKKGSGEPYESDPKETETISDFDTWWDSGWGIAIEIGVGVLASLVTGGLAGVLLTAARAGRIVGLLGRTILALDKMRYLGGGVTMLTVLTESLVEAGLMIPIAVYQFSRGKDSDGVLSIALSFLPFFTNVPAVSKYIKSGKIFRKSDAETIMQKVTQEGGFEVLDASKEKTANFLLSLTPDQQEMYKAAVTMLKESPDDFSKGLIEVLNKEGDKITEGIAKNKKLDKTALEKVAEVAKENVSIRSGTGILPQFVRAGIPIAGLFVLPTVFIFDYFKSVGLSEKTAGELTNQFGETIEGSKYLAKINTLHEKLGLGIETTNEVVLDTLKKQIAENPNMIKEIIASDAVQKKYFNQDKINKDAMEIVKAEQKKYKDAFLGGQTNETIILDIMDEIGIMDKQIAIIEKINTKNYDVEKWDDTSNNTNWKFTTTDGKPGLVNFLKDGTFEVLINNINIFNS